VVLVPFLLVRAPRSITIDHVAKSAGKDYENEDQEDEWRHTVILYLLVYGPDTRLAFNGHRIVIWRTLHTLCSLLAMRQVYLAVPPAPTGEKHSFSITIHSLSIEEGMGGHARISDL